MNAAERGVAGGGDHCDNGIINELFVAQSHFECVYTTVLCPNELGKHGTSSTIRLTKESALMTP